MMMVSVYPHLLRMTVLSLPLLQRGTVVMALLLLKTFSVPGLLLTTIVSVPLHHPQIGVVVPPHLLKTEVLLCRYTERKLHPKQSLCVIYLFMCYQLFFGMEVKFECVCLCVFSFVFLKVDYPGPQPLAALSWRIPVRSPVEPRPYFMLNPRVRPFPPVRPHSWSRPVYRNPMWSCPARSHRGGTAAIWSSPGNERRFAGRMHLNRPLK